MTEAMLRDAGPDDAASIARVHVEGWRTAYRGLFPDAYLDGLDESKRAADWRRRLPARAARHTVVALEADEVTGFASGGPERGQHGSDAEVYAIYVLSTARRRGIGGRLMARVFAGFRDDCRRSAHLWVHAGNVAGEAFYRRLGGVAGARADHAEPVPHTVVSYEWDRVGIERVSAMDRA
ncbi:MAG: GNAT family N-acetyltransferase [Alphaproteobacteria bacterium]|nr:GNAT family N-acetyltransferase [Alphaproteobacteria bacterium]